jgi:DNA-directed RNA polymerase subunit beta
MQVIFGSKSKNIKDSSLRVPHGGEGVVIKVEKMNKFDGYNLDDEVIETVKITIAQKRKIEVGDKLANRHGNKGVISVVVPECDMPFMADGTPVDIVYNPEGVPGRMNIGQIYELHLGFAMRELAKKNFVNFVNTNADVKEISQLFGIDETKTKVLVKNAKIYADKLGGKISVEDVAIILNNSGLRIEDLNYKVASAPFAGAKQDDIIAAQSEAGLNKNDKGMVELFDGRTGEKYSNKIAVGVLLVMKLDHMVADKIHARAVGPYSKITQQPLGGKVRNGGQRMGEMEV